MLNLFVAQNTNTVFPLISALVVYVILKLWDPALKRGRYLFQKKRNYEKFRNFAILFFQVATNNYHYHV